VESEKVPAIFFRRMPSPMTSTPLWTWFDDVQGDEQGLTFEGAGF
jgi:hypothetical protein